MEKPRLIEPGSSGTRPCTESTYRRGGLTRAESTDPERGLECKHMDFKKKDQTMKDSGVQQSLLKNTIIIAVK